MKEVQYALIASDDAGKRVAIVGTHREPLTRHRKVTPELHKLCASLFALHKRAVQIEVKAWTAGVNVENAPRLVLALRTETAGQIDYHVTETRACSPDQDDDPGPRAA